MSTLTRLPRCMPRLPLAPPPPVRARSSDSRASFFSEEMHSCCRTAAVAIQWPEWGGSAFAGNTHLGRAAVRAAAAGAAAVRAALEMRADAPCGGAVGGQAAGMQCSMSHPMLRPCQLPSSSQRTREARLPSCSPNSAAPRLPLRGGRRMRRVRRLGQPACAAILALPLLLLLQPHCSLRDEEEVEDMPHLREVAAVQRLRSRRHTAARALTETALREVASATAPRRRRRRGRLPGLRCGALSSTTGCRH